MINYPWRSIELVFFSSMKNTASTVNQYFRNFHHECDHWSIGMRELRCLLEYLPWIIWPEPVRPLLAGCGGVPLQLWPCRGNSAGWTSFLCLWSSKSLSCAYHSADMIFFLDFEQVPCWLLIRKYKKKRKKWFRRPTIWHLTHCNCLARPTRLERATFGFEGRWSILLSYRRIDNINIINSLGC